MAFKAKEMSIPCSFGDIDPMNGTFAASQKEKLDKMKGSDQEDPFYEYDCRKKRNLNCFHFVKKHTKINCNGHGCLTRANRRCRYKMCRSCCIQYKRDFRGEPPCNMKEHHDKAGNSPADEDSNSDNNEEEDYAGDGDTS
jgi:hypothetical protein